MADYEFFKKEFEFRGKHARMVSELWISNDYEHTFFKRLIDLYVVAAVVGFRADRKAPPDSAPFEPKSIFPEQMLKAKEDLDFILQMILMLEYRNTMSTEESVKRAFRGPQSKEEYDAALNLFNSYVRGGVEELYEILVVRKGAGENEYYDQKTNDLMRVMERYGG